MAEALFLCGLLGIDGGTVERRVSVRTAVCVLLHDDFWRGPQIAETDSSHPGGQKTVEMPRVQF